MRPQGGTGRGPWWWLTLSLRTSHNVAEPDKAENPHIRLTQTAHQVVVGLSEEEVKLYRPRSRCLICFLTHFRKSRFEALLQRQGASSEEGKDGRQQRRVRSRRTEEASVIG